LDCRRRQGGIVGLAVGGGLLGIGIIAERRGRVGAIAF